MPSVMSDVTNSVSSARRSNRPMPLKQRTSSIDTRKDYSYFQTWWSLRDLIKLRECLIVVNYYPIWRRHLAWAMENGGDLRNYMTQRYASSMVFLSLMLAAELNVLFNSSQITTNIRLTLHEQKHFTLQFWIGFTILVSIIMTLISLVVTFTAWGMVSAISDENAHCILRSSIGQYVGELPQRFTVASIYSFLLWMQMMIFILIPVGFWSILLFLIVVFLLFHTITVFSAFGRLILHTTAMSPNRIFEEGYEKALTPQPLQEQLHVKAMAELSNGTSITRQYRRKLKPLDRKYDQVELAAVMRKSGNRSTISPTKVTTVTEDEQPFPPPPSSMANRGRIQSTADGGVGGGGGIMRTGEYDGGRKRADSTVRFADQLMPPAPARREVSHAAGPPKHLTPTAEERSQMSQSIARGTADSPANTTLASSRGPVDRRKDSSFSDDSFANGDDANNDESMIMSMPPMTQKQKNDSFSLMPPDIPPPPPDNTPRGFSVLSVGDWLSGATPLSTPGMQDPTHRKTLSNGSRQMPRPPREVQTLRSMSGVSVLSSFDDGEIASRFGVSSTSYADRPLTDDEKFDLDYGEDFLDHSSAAVDGFHGGGDGRGGAYQNNDGEDMVTGGETQGLLSHGSSPPNYYSSNADTEHKDMV